MSGRRKRRNREHQDGHVSRIIARVGRPVVGYLSELARESLRQPGSWRCLEIVYRDEPQTLLDRFWLSSRAARGARSRLRTLTENLCEIVQSRATAGGAVRLLSLGSGPGHEILGCIERVRGQARVEATCMDLDPEALRYGEGLAARRDLDGHVRYVCGNVLCADALPAGQDIVVLSGLLDYFDSRIAVTILGNVHKRLTPGGIVLVANMRRHHLAATMSILGNWRLVYREPRDVERLLTEGGYTRVEVELEPEGIFCIGRGQKPDLNAGLAGQRASGASL